MDRLLREGNPPVGQLASPIPQYKKPGSTDYEAVEGQHGAPFATLKDASGNVVSPATEAKLEQVRALLSGVATENKLEQARVLLNTISTKDFATQTTLAAVLAKLGQLETEIQAVKANQLSGDQKVQLSGTRIEEAVWESLAIADTNSRNKLLDTSRMKNWTLTIVSSLDKPVRITFTTIDGSYGYWIRVWDEKEGTFTLDASQVGIVIPSSSSGPIAYNLTNHPLLKKIQNQNIRLHLKADEPPTSGSITIRLVGEPL